MLEATMESGQLFIPILLGVIQCREEIDGVQGGLLLQTHFCF